MAAASLYSAATVAAGGTTTQPLSGGTSPVDPITIARLRQAEGMAVQLRIGSVTGGVGTDTFDCYVQHSVDGATWDDFIHFPQVTNTQASAVAARLAFWSIESVPTTPTKTPQDAALAVGTVQQGPTGEYIRCKFVTTGTTVWNQVTVIASAVGDLDD
jgi:hypothetical protein